MYKTEPTLCKISFSIEKGKLTGIKGTSGKGKTTLMNLLLGFLSPSSGEILFNGKMKKTYERQSSWNKISYVKQEPFMLHDSILNNIVLFEKGIDYTRLNDVIEATGLKSLVDQFPERLEKIITEDGKNISGGQRQRIAIARALYKDSDVIILDEPFNELDEPSELAMLNYFQQLSRKNKIIILITHSEKSLSSCDTVIDLHEY